MLERMRRFGRELTGRNSGVLIGHLVDQLDATLDAVGTVRAVAAGQLSTAEGRAQVGDLEDVGDGARRALIHDLSRTLAAPIDREDLFRLSRSVDDVLDNLRDLAREFDLFEVSGEPLMAEPLGNVADGVAALRDAVECLLDAPEHASLRAAEAKKNDVRASYQHALAELLTDGQQVTPELLRRRELLRRVDVTGLRLAEAADALADGAIKRSH
ncbi:MAG: DUF47 family protein [Nitriliruptor sp.]|uniref:DUF47 domain-containing protein n=1 Tax=Nitriliruptor sp. TaxID=2448056 RepID=UPI0034A03D4D